MAGTGAGTEPELLTAAIRRIRAARAARAAALVTIVEDGYGWLLVRADGEVLRWVSADLAGFETVARLVARSQDRAALALETGRRVELV